MKQYVARTMNEHCIGGLGGFGGLFELDCTGYKHPVLVSGTDGVGTKLKIAMMHGQARYHRHRLRGHVRQRRDLLPVQSRWCSWITSPAVAGNTTATETVTIGDVAAETKSRDLKFLQVACSSVQFFAGNGKRTQLSESL